MQGGTAVCSAHHTAAQGQGLGDWKRPTGHSSYQRWSLVLEEGEGWLVEEVVGVRGLRWWGLGGGRTGGCLVVEKVGAW